jgi:formate hydrogenlyase subunit 3/multisubunit Na+/H+ antiporter MnhD subunit
MKITLFMCAGAIMVITGKRAVSELSGVGRKIPITMAAFTIGAMGMCGMPPIAGFISKWYLCLGCVQAYETISPVMIVFMFVLLIASLMDVVYFFPIIYTAFFGKLGEGEESGRRKWMGGKEASFYDHSLTDNFYFRCPFIFLPKHISYI